MGGGTIVKEGYLIKSPPLSSKGVKVSQEAVAGRAQCCGDRALVAVRIPYRPRAAVCASTISKLHRQVSWTVCANVTCV